MNHGDLFWVELPDRGGKEQRGLRPAVIVQDTDMFSDLPTILIIPLTSRLGALRFSATLRIEPSAANGLTTPSVALVFSIRCLRRPSDSESTWQIGPERLAQSRSDHTATAEAWLEDIRPERSQKELAPW